jgi:hypothetical protein
MNRCRGQCPFKKKRTLQYKHRETRVTLALVVFGDKHIMFYYLSQRAVSAVAWLGSGQPARLGSIPAGDDFQVSHRGFAPE